MYRITTLQLSTFWLAALIVISLAGWVDASLKLAAIKADRDNLEHALRYWTDRHEAVGASPVAVYEASASIGDIERASAVAGSAGTASAPPYDVRARQVPPWKLSGFTDPDVIGTWRIIGGAWRFVPSPETSEPQVEKASADDAPLLATAGWQFVYPEDQPVEWTFYKTKPLKRFCHSKRLLLEAGGFRIEAWICGE